MAIAAYERKAAREAAQAGGASSYSYGGKTYQTSTGNLISSQSVTTTPVPTINPTSIVSSILSGQVPVNQVQSYVTDQVKSQYGSNSAGLTAFTNEGQKAIDGIYSQLSGKALTIGNDSYQFGSGGQAIKNSTTVRNSVSTSGGTTVQTSSYTGPSVVDYLNSIGTPSDFSTRASLAKTVGITDYTGSAEQNTTLLSALKLAQATPKTTPLANPVVAPTTGGTTTAPTFPVPQAGSTLDTYTQSLTAQLNAQKDALQKEADKRVADYQRQIDEQNNRTSELQVLQDQGMENIESTTMDEVRQKTEALNLEKERFDENYNANQQLINEMDSLLTTGNQVIQQMKDTTGLSSILSPRIAKTMSDITARAGVIQAVISARNGQMTYAQQQLDTTFQAISSIATDQINYYKTLVDFYQNQKSEAGTKLLSLTKDQKDYLDVKIKLLEQDLANTQETAKIISKAMLSPDTAMTYAASGVSMTDSPEQINAKLANYAYSQELKSKDNEMNTSGYTSTPIAGVKPTVITDSQGNQKNWYKVPTAKSPSSDDIRQTNYAKAQKFVADNPNASPAELEQAIRANTQNLTEADIESLVGKKSKLTRASVSALFDIPDNSSKSGGFLGFGGEVNSTKLDAIMALIKKYQDVGYTDDEIMKLMQK